MLKRTLAVTALVLAGALCWFTAVGKGWIGGAAWESAQVIVGPRPAGDAADNTPQILFGDLHTHTNYSLDAYAFNTEMVKGIGVMTPADACDFARYCSALDFWSINDHAEGLTPRVWADTVSVVRACNAQAGDPGNPDMVSFVGWEWSNTARDDVPSHYGHKNVIFRTWEPGRTPTRPIASRDNYIFARVPSPLLGMLSLLGSLDEVSDFNWYINESANVPVCPEGVPSGQLPDDCREVALTPTDLYRKLDEWGLDSLVIPHGLAWGTTNPLSADFRNQMDEYQNRYEKLLETYSGHGNSERYASYQRAALNAEGAVEGAAECPESTEQFIPCCRQAERIARKRCEAPGSDVCEQEVASLVDEFVAAGPRKGRRLLPDTTPNDWEGCGQLRAAFQPAADYIALQSTQYTLALGFDENGAPSRARFGLIGSSDNHVARPGSSYKEMNRPLRTDSKSVRGADTPGFFTRSEANAFYYTGGLVAVHSEGRHRDAIWQALDTRNVYATSGDRMLVWFDLLNAPAGEIPMGSETSMSAVPRFRVKALGAFEQQAGCPEYAVAALGAERAQSLCGGECYRPADRRKAITRIEIARIRPQIAANEPIAPLVEHAWRVFECPADGSGCTVEFEDSEYPASGRPAVYYARVIQEAEPLINGQPFGCETDDAGNCERYRFCLGADAPADADCTALNEPRAWTSPIFVEPAK